jgi:hypothetical protein
VTLRNPAIRPSFISPAAVFESVARFGRFGRGGGSWHTDAWDADYKYMWGIQRLTNVKLSPDPNPVAIMDPSCSSIPIFMR